MAIRRLWCVFLVLLNEFSPCLADSADPSAWDVKDNIKFGVAEPNVEVCVPCWRVCFVLLVLAGAQKQVNFTRKYTNSIGGVWNNSLHLLIVNQKTTQYGYD